MRLKKIFLWKQIMYFHKYQSDNSRPTGHGCITTKIFDLQIYIYQIRVIIFLKSESTLNIWIWRAGREGNRLQKFDLHESKFYYYKSTSKTYLPGICWPSSVDGRRLIILLFCPKISVYVEISYWNLFFYLPWISN